MIAVDQTIDETPAYYFYISVKFHFQVLRRFSWEHMIAVDQTIDETQVYYYYSSLTFPLP